MMALKIQMKLVKDYGYLNLVGAVTLVSIPLFISAGKHKKKAKIQLQNGAVVFNNEFKYSGVSFTFAF